MGNLMRKAFTFLCNQKDAWTQHKTYARLYHDIKEKNWYLTTIISGKNAEYEKANISRSHITDMFLIQTTFIKMRFKII
jgi:hypothetical protein